MQQRAIPQVSKTLTRRMVRTRQASVFHCLQAKLCIDKAT